MTLHARPNAEVSFRRNARNEAAEIPLSAWTEVLTDGERVFIRTSRPVPLLEALCASAAASGADLPDIEVSPRYGGASARRFPRTDSEP